MHDENQEMFYQKVILLQKWSIQLEIESKFHYEWRDEFDDDLFHNVTYRNIK